MTSFRVVGVRGWSLLLVLLVLAGGGGYFGSKWIGASRATDDEPAADSVGEDVWYTCGMHPQVLQREPGNCPICGMKLTPRKEHADDNAAPSSGPQERKVLYWRSPMHPDFVSETPGKDPMGHDLVPVYADEGETVGGTVLRIDPVVVQNMGIRTARVRRGPLVKVIRTVGRVDYDEQTVIYVDTKIGGWIEKLHVNETGQSVKAADPLFEVYSPDLWQAQIELISAVRKLPLLERSTLPDAVEDARQMVDAARLKLDYFDVSHDQIARLEKTLKAEKTIQIRSPADGIVAEKMALEGMRIMPGMRLYTIADLSRVWVYVDIYEYQLPWVHVGQPAAMNLPYIPEKAFRGKVAYIYPYLQKQTRVIKVRLEFDNPTLQLKPDMYANITLEGLLKENALLIPREGYIDSGTRKVAFVDRGGGKFEPRDVQVGVEGEGGAVEVLFGLDDGDVVVTSGQFLLDTESKLKEAVAKMTEPSRAGPRKPGVATSRPTGVPADAAYACPMDRHPDEDDPARQGAYFSDVPGECPWCGMTLRPVGELAWAMALRTAEGADVAYTCPDHPHVFSESPGTCPRCQRALEPFKSLYTCPDSRHSRQGNVMRGDCPLCGEPMVAWRGSWLGEKMAALNPSPSETPAVETGTPPTETPVAQKSIPSDARFTCPMEECWAFSEEEGRCPTCGMKLRSLDQVAWAAKLLDATGASARFVCPMHPDRATSAEPGLCPICSMRLVRREDVIGLEAGPSTVQTQIDFLMEHYLGIQEQLAADRTDALASHALGLVDAGETLGRLLRDDARADAEALRAAVIRLHDAALKIKGPPLSAARIQFADLTAAMRTIMAIQRPDKSRWPALYVFHCPMSQADWIQPVETKANPYYGFKMLDCGNLVETK